MSSLTFKRHLKSLLSFPGAFRDFAPRFRNIVEFIFKTLRLRRTLHSLPGGYYCLTFCILTLKNNAKHCYKWKSLTPRFFIVSRNGLKMLWGVWVLKLCLKILPSFPVRYYCSMFHIFTFKKTLMFLTCGFYTFSRRCVKFNLKRCL